MHSHRHLCCIGGPHPAYKYIMSSHKTPLRVVKPVLLSRQQADAVAQWRGTGGAYLGDVSELSSLAQRKGSGGRGAVAGCEEIKCRSSPPTKRRRRHAEMRDCDFYQLQQQAEGVGVVRGRGGGSSRQRVIDPQGRRLARCLRPDVCFSSPQVKIEREKPRSAHERDEADEALQLVQLQFQPWFLLISLIVFLSRYRYTWPFVL